MVGGLSNVEVGGGAGDAGSSSSRRSDCKNPKKSLLSVVVVWLLLIDEGSAGWEGAKAEKGCPDSKSVVCMENVTLGVTLAARLGALGRC